MSLIMSIFLKNICEKWLKKSFFPKINLVMSRKKIQDLFSAFESQGNIQFEYTYID